VSGREVNVLVLSSMFSWTLWISLRWYLFGLYDCNYCFFPTYKCI